MIVSQTLRSSSIKRPEWLGLTLLLLLRTYPTALYHFPVDCFGRVSAFFNLCPHFLILLKTRLGLTEKRLSPDTAHFSVQMVLEVPVAPLCPNMSPPRHGERMTPVETNSQPMQLESLFINQFQSRADFFWKTNDMYLVPLSSVSARPE